MPPGPRGQRGRLHSYAQLTVRSRFQMNERQRAEHRRDRSWRRRERCAAAPRSRLGASSALAMDPRAPTVAMRAGLIAAGTTEARRFNRVTPFGSRARGLAKLSAAASYPPVAGPPGPVVVSRVDDDRAARKGTSDQIPQTLWTGGPTTGSRFAVKPAPAAKRDAGCAFTPGWGDLAQLSRASREELGLHVGLAQKRRAAADRQKARAPF